MVEVIVGFLVSAAATLIGVFLAFQLERRREDRARKERLIGPPQMIRDEMQRNVDECKHIQVDFGKYGPNYVQYYSLKTTTWEAVSPALVDLKSPKLSKNIANEYYEYYHMNRKLDARFDLFKLVLTAKAAMGPSPFTALTTAVLAGTQTLPKSGSDIVDAIDKEIQRLRDC